jgi:hypothetical protein
MSRSEVQDWSVVRTRRVVIGVQSKISVVVTLELSSYTVEIEVLVLVRKNIMLSPVLIPEFAIC